MRTIFDLSELDGILKSIQNGSELESKIKEEIERQTVGAFNRERFFSIPIAGDVNDPFLFEFLNCQIALHLKRVYSDKTYKVVKDIYSIEAYRIYHAERSNAYDEFNITEYKKSLTSRLSDIETLYC